MNVFIFFTVFSLIAGSLAVYMTWRLFGKVPIRRIWKVLIALGIVGILFITPLGIVFRRFGIESAGSTALVWVGYLGIGFLSFIFTFLVICDVTLLPVFIVRFGSRLFKRRQQKKTSNALPMDYARRRFLVSGVNYGIMASAGIFTAYGFAEARQTPDIKRVSIPVAGLPSGLDGFRIVQITDIHVSQTVGRPFVEKIVDVANSLEADIVALTGDLVDGSVDRFSSDVAPLGGLRSRYGNFFVTGNHEYYSGVHEWLGELNRLGFTTLLNEHRMITHGNGRLLLAGVTDYRGGSFSQHHRSDPYNALKNAPLSDLKILLAHQPKTIFEAARAGFDIQISGHTHGGQFFPWIFAVGLNQPYVAGLHKHDKTQIYVSRGTGYWGPPVRVGSPSEITLIKLRSRYEIHHVK